VKKIGIIIDEYHLKYKVDEFLKYLNSKADVKIYIEESFNTIAYGLNFKSCIIFHIEKGEQDIGK